jgi:hypothetical protein
MQLIRISLLVHLSREERLRAARSRIWWQIAKPGAEVPSLSTPIRATPPEKESTVLMDSTRETSPARASFQPVSVISVAGLEHSANPVNMDLGFTNPLYHR